jgi:hypothetical protein
LSLQYNFYHFKEQKYYFRTFDEVIKCQHTHRKIVNLSSFSFWEI